MSDAEIAYASMERAFERALARRGPAPPPAPYLFGGHGVEIRAVGQRLAREVLQPFAHLRTAGPVRDGVRLTIDLWDEAETGGDGDGIGSPLDDGLQWMVESPDRRFVVQRLTRGLAGLDRARERLVACLRWDAGVPNVERARPLGRPLVQWYGDRGFHVVHAALVARNDAGVLVAGHKGAGKSTLALASVRAGLAYLGDDCVAVEPTADGSFVGHSLFGTALVEATPVTALAELGTHVVPPRAPTDRKSVVFLGQRFPDRLRRSVALRVLLLSRVTGTGGTRLRRATRAEALRWMAPNTLLRALTRGLVSLENLAELVERVPAYWIEQGDDPDRCVDVLTAFLDELSPSAPAASSTPPS